MQRNPSNLSRDFSAQRSSWRLRLARVRFRLASPALSVSLLLGILPWFPARSLGQVGVSRETLIKAAYLLKFPLYVTWPKEAFESTSSAIVIGILDDGSIGRVLERRAPKVTAKGRKIIVLRFKSLDDYSPCHILFVPRSVDRNVQSAAVARTRDSPVLVVGHREGFAAAGGAINFYLDRDTTIGFEINRDVTVQRGLLIDARLLNLARVVRTQRPPEGS